jgi:hypothetical protein
MGFYWNANTKERGHRMDPNGKTCPPSIIRFWPKGKKEKIIAGWVAFLKNNGGIVAWKWARKCIDAKKI